MQFGYAPYHGKTHARALRSAEVHAVAVTVEYAGQLLRRNTGAVIVNADDEIGVRSEQGYAYPAVSSAVVKAVGDEVEQELPDKHSVGNDPHVGLGVKADAHILLIHNRIQRVDSAAAELGDVYGLGAEGQGMVGKAGKRIVIVYRSLYSVIAAIEAAHIFKQLLVALVLCEHRDAGRGELDVGHGGFET